MQGKKEYIAVLIEIAALGEDAVRCSGPEEFTEVDIYESDWV